MRILVVGANGMIGSTVLRVLSKQTDWWVGGTVRNDAWKQFFSPQLSDRIKSGIDIENFDSLVNLFNQIQPNIVINCAGLTKHKPGAEDLLMATQINILVPHRLAALCKLSGARLIHISTDCVFSGERGSYFETDNPDAQDVYGKTKALGEVVYPHTVTLRTSTIGHELNTRYGLLEWFLAQSERCSGYTHAVFSGVPTVILAQVIRDRIIPNQKLSGLFHVAASPINKFDLLQLIAKIYSKPIEIIPNGELVIDRSLNGSLFQKMTGFIAPDWETMIKIMYASQSN